MLAALCYSGLRALKITALARRLQHGGVVLCYHNVVSASATCGDPSLHLPLATFEGHMRWLVANCELVSLPEFIGRIQRGASLRHLATVTFDDGYAGVFQNGWPLLSELRIPAAVFVVAAAPNRTRGFWWDHPAVLRENTPARRRRWMTALRGDGEAILRALGAESEEIRVPASHEPADWRAIASAAAHGMSVGVHSATHRSLPSLDDRELRYEVIASRELIARETGVDPQVFAYPYGLWDERVERAVRAAGYRAAVTLDYGSNDVAAKLTALRRINIPAWISDSAFEAWTSGLCLRRRWAR